MNHLRVSTTLGVAGLLAATLACSGPSSDQASGPLGYAYVSNHGSNNISQFIIGADGMLKEMSPPTVAAGSSPNSIAVHPSGKWAYVANGGGTVSQYNIGAGGALTPMSPSTTAAGADPRFIAVDPTGRYAYVANYGTESEASTISQYTIDPSTGALSAMYTPAVLVAEQYGTATAIAVDPAGKHLHVTQYSGSLSNYAIGTGGALTFVSSNYVSHAPNSPVHIAIHASGKFAYVANYGEPSLNQLTMDASGALTGSAWLSRPSGDTWVAVAPSGAYAYVVNNTANTVSQYAIQPDGTLIGVGSDVAAGSGSRSMAIEPGGKFAYVASDDGRVSQYAVGTDGKLTPLGPAAFAFGYAYAIAVLVR